MENKCFAAMLEKSIGIPDYLFTDTLSTWCMPKHVVERIPSDIILEKSIKQLWFAYLNAFENLSKEKTYGSKIQKYLKTCHEYLSQSRPKKVFEKTVNECKGRFKEAEMERRLRRARSRAEQEGAILGAELTERGINEPRKRIQGRPIESSQQNAEEQEGMCVLSKELVGSDTKLDTQMTIRMKTMMLATAIKIHRKS